MKEWKEKGTASKMDLSGMIKDYRKKHALSQGDFGSRIGVTMCMICYVENYYRHAGNKVLKGIAEELEIPITEVTQANEEQKLKIQQLKLKKGERKA